MLFNGLGILPLGMWSALKVVHALLPLYIRRIHDFHFSKMPRSQGSPYIILKGGTARLLLFCESSPKGLGLDEDAVFMLGNVVQICARVRIQALRLALLL